jgi:hypothetical protein
MLRDYLRRLISQAIEVVQILKSVLEPDPEPAPEVSPRVALLRDLVDRRIIPPHWFDMLNDRRVISNDVHVPRLESNTSNEEYLELQRVEDQLGTMFKHFWDLGGCDAESKYHALADFLQTAHRMTTGARQQYEQLRFSEGELRMSTRPEDVKAAADEAAAAYEDEDEEQQ